MNERIDPKLQEEWNKKLESAGLPEELEPIEIPIQPSGKKQILEALGPEIEPSLIEFAYLPEKLQDDILADLKQQREKRMPSKEILNRFEVLVAKGRELDLMTSSDLDKNYKPAPSREELEQIELEKDISEKVDNLIRSIETIRQSDSPAPTPPKDEDLPVN